MTNKKEQLTIVKVGGAVVEDEARLGRLISDFSHISGRKILVHGGGLIHTDGLAHGHWEAHGGRTVTCPVW